MAELGYAPAWRERKAKKILTANPEEFRETLLKLLPLLGHSKSWMVDLTTSARCQPKPRQVLVAGP